MPRIEVARPEPHDSLLVVDPPMPRDPHLRQIADDVVAQVKYAIVQAAAEDAPARDRLGEVARSLVASRPQREREHARMQARSLLAAPEVVRQRHFGRLAGLQTAAYRSQGFEAAPKLSINADALKAAFARSGAVLRNASGGSNPDVLAGAQYKTMKLFVRRVRCIDETDGEWGSDEIALGGTVTDALGKTSLVSQFLVHDDFDKGEVKNYGFSKVFCSWALQTGAAGFPYVYSAVIAMAEKDGGGFGKILQELWDIVDDKVKAAVGAAIGSAIGAAIGSAIPGLGTLIGAVFGLLIGWIISLFDNPDDMIGTRVTMMTLGAATKSYYDWAKLTSAEGWTHTLTFRGDGGHYKVDLSYRIFT